MFSLASVAGLVAPAAHAQYGGYSSHAWATTYSANGTTSVDGTGLNPTPYIFNWPATATGGYWPYQPGYVDANVSGKITATLTWYPATGQTLATDPPSEPVYIAEEASAWEIPGSWAGQGPAPTPAGSADNGLGDAQQVDGSGYISKGTHLIQKDRSSGTITLDPVTMSGINPITTMGSNGPDWLWGSASAYMSAQADSRGVTISCPTVDTSQYRDPPITGNIIVNKRQPDGSLRGDTVLYNNINGDQMAGNSQSFNYHANVAGSWSGTYHWFSSLTGYNDAGSFPSVPDFGVPVSYFTGGSSAASNAGASDHIFLSMYGGTDGAEATGNYTMHFHDEWEPASWPVDPGYPKKVMGPDPDMPSWPVYSWKEMTPLAELTYSTPSEDVTYQEAGIESVDGGLDLDVDPVTLHFGISGNPTDKFTAAQTLKANPPLGQFQETWAVYREVVSRTKGHLDHYQIHGYTGTGVWWHDKMQGIDLNLYQPYQSSSTLASDPPVGWNPPGY